MVGIIIQARTGSTRLPNKMLLPFYNGNGILETILKRLTDTELNIPIILATTINSQDDKIEYIAQRNNVKVYRGSEDNVLERFIMAAEKNNIQKIIRICADNPFLDIEAIKFQIKKFKESDVDYWCYCKSDKTPTIITHYGFWTEGVKLETLKRILIKTNNSLYLEHVTNYIYSHTSDFKIHYEQISREIEKVYDIRLTIDTIEDFELSQKIYSTVINKIPFKSENIVVFVKDHPEWIQLMKNEINNNKK